MNTFFIEELEKEIGIGKRKIYNFIRRKSFYEKFDLEKMADLPEKARNGSISKVLTEDMYNYLKEQLAGETGFRKSDDDVRDVVYIAELHHGYKMVDEEGNEQRRFKVGYTSKWIHERESNIQVTSPEARIIRYWKISSSDERTLHKFIDGNGGKRIGSSEVYNVTDLDQFLSAIENFYQNISK